MKKKYYFTIGYILFVIVLSMSLYNISNTEKIGEMYSSLYESLDYSIDIIENNMNEITVSNDDWAWAKLREANLQDEQLENTYNLIVSDIRTCYLLSNDLENETYDNIKLLSLKNKTNTTTDLLTELNKKENCLKIFDKYNSLILSDHNELSEKIQKQINIIIDNKEENIAFKKFEELLYEELLTMSKIASLSNWLKTEYYSRKK